MTERILILISELGCPATFSARIQPFEDDIYEEVEEKPDIFSTDDMKDR